MSALFASALLASLAFALAVAFAAPERRWRWRALLVGAVVLSWLALGWSLSEIVARTAGALGTTPSRALGRPQLLWPAAKQAGPLLASLVAPVLLVTLLGWLSLRATRPGRRRTPGP